MIFGRRSRENAASRPDGLSLIGPDRLDRWTELATVGLGPQAGSFLRAALLRTLDRTLHPNPDGSYYVITGDIPAMWLRDSSAQMWPYLRIVAEDPHGLLGDVLVGVVRRQFALMAHDPYANAFNARPSGAAYDPGDHDRDPWIWERKYEVDTLCLPIDLAYRLHRLGRRDVVDEGLLTGARAAVDTLALERDHEARSAYRFVRNTDNPLETLSRNGLGSPVGITGMTWSGFRPSDDACTYGYNIPANLLAASATGKLASLIRENQVAGNGSAGDNPVTGTASDSETLARDAEQLSAALAEATAAHGVVELPGVGEIYAYEIDGLGHDVVMDDANLPSLLGLPLYSEVNHDDPVYQRTRAAVLSPANPFYYQGSVASGIGSPHTPPEHVWPIALATEGLTSDDPARRRELVDLLLSTTGRDGHVHESFHRNDAGLFTREWFSWADSMVCELIMDFCERA